MKDEETVALVAGGNCEVVCLITDCKRPRLEILSDADCSALRRDKCSDAGYDEADDERDGESIVDVELPPFLNIGETLIVKLLFVLPNEPLFVVGANSDDHLVRLAELFRSCSSVSPSIFFLHFVDTLSVLLVISSAMSEMQAQNCDRSPLGQLELKGSLCYSR